MVGVHIPEIRKSEYYNNEIKREENRNPFEKVDSQEKGTIINAPKGRKSTTSKAESAKLKEKKNDFFEDSQKIDQNSQNHKDLDSDISLFEKNLNFSESNNDISLNNFDNIINHAYKDVISIY